MDEIFDYNVFSHFFNPFKQIFLTFRHRFEYELSKKTQKEKAPSSKDAPSMKKNQKSTEDDEGSDIYDPKNNLMDALSVKSENTSQKQIEKIKEKRCLINGKFENR